MEKKLFILLFAMAFLAGSSAMAGNDNTGTSAANFLKLGVGPRAEAMGGAFVAQANDFTALYWNPAGIARIEGLQIGITRSEWILDITHTFVGATYNLGERLGTIGFSFNYLNMGEMERTTPTEPDGDGSFFTPSDMAVGIAYSRVLTDRFTVGAKFKYIREQISYSSASAMAIDVGTQFVTGFYGMRIGMAITNFGGKMLMMGTDQLVKADADDLIEGNPDKDARLETESWPLPMIYRIGFSLDALNRDDTQLTINADFNDPRDVDPYFTVGAEFGYRNLAFLRGGIIYRPDSYDVDKFNADNEVDLLYELRFAFGGGINFTVPGMDTNMAIDYAYSDMGFLDYMHKFSIKFSL